MQVVPPESHPIQRRAHPLAHVAGKILRHVCRHHMPTKRGLMSPTTGCLSASDTHICGPCERPLARSASFFFFFLLAGVNIYTARMTHLSNRPTLEKEKRKKKNGKIKFVSEFNSSFFLFFVFLHLPSPLSFFPQ